MSNRLPCEDVQELLFELQRDELSDLKRAEVDEHLGTCQECAELAAKTGEMFEAAAEGDAQVWADIDPDPLFERIEATITEDSQPHASDDHAKLDEMFEAARAADADTFASFDLDALFDRIAQQTHPPTDTDANDQRSDDEQRSRPRRRRVWAAIAAAACATLIAWWGLSPDDPSPDDPSPVAPEAGQTADLATPEADESDQAGDEDQANQPDEKKQRVATQEPSPSPAISVPSMQPAPTEKESVRLFASRDAEYAFDTDDEHPTVNLDRGSVLVEYLPGSTSQFSVRARDHTITVVGTVFLVTIHDEEVRVAVFEGAVRVTSPDGATREVESAEYIAGEQRGELTEAVTVQVERHVDLAAHRQALLQAREVQAHEPATVEPDAPREPLARAENPSPPRPNHPAPSADSAPEADVPEADVPEADVPEADVPEAEQPEAEQPEAEQPEAEQPEAEQPQPAAVAAKEAPPEESLDEPEADSARKLREAALQALHGGEHRRAANLLSQALQKTAPADRANADILLELARIHLHKLDEPQRAAHYLRRFVDQWPDDPAADAIRTQLCAMDALDSSDEALCN